MAVNRTFLYWGSFFVAMGAIMVAVELAGVDAPLIGEAVRLWPLVVIAIGLGFVLRRTRFSLAGGMLAAAMPGLVLGGAFAAGPRVAGTCASGQPATYEQQAGSFQGAAAVHVTLGCGDLDVNTAAGQGWNLQAGNTEGVRADVAASPTGLTLTSARRGNWFGQLGGRDVWRLTLPTGVPLDLDGQVDAGRGRLDLRGAQLGTLSLVVNAAEARVDLTGATLRQLTTRLNAGTTHLVLPAADFDGSISVNAGSLKVCAPPELGLQVDSKATLGSATWNGLVQNGSTWQSPGYATASHRAHLAVDVNVGSVQFNPIGGCQ